MSNIRENKKLWLTLFLLSWIPTLLSYWIANVEAGTYRYYIYNCRIHLLNLASALEMYCDDHGGCLPSASGPDDYFYWTKGITNEYLREINLYCPWDNAEKDPSSYVSDPRLAGRKLSDLKKIPHLVILREREYRHQGHRAAFYGSDFYGMYSKEELPKDIKYNPDLPERETKEVPVKHYPCRNFSYFNYFFFFLGLTVTFYILWGLSRRRPKGETGGKSKA